MSTELLALPAAAFFATLGIAALIQPDRIYRTFGILASTVEARTEVRAVYGGFGLAFGILIGVAPFLDQGEANGIYLASAISSFGMAAGRLIASAIERPPRFYPVWFWFVAEIVVGGALMLARQAG